MGPLVDTCDLRWETLSEWLNSARGVSPAQNCGYEWSRSVERDQYLGICVWSGSRYSTGLIHWIMHRMYTSKQWRRRSSGTFQGKQVLEIMKCVENTHCPTRDCRATGWMNANWKDVTMVKEDSEITVQKQWWLGSVWTHSPHILTALYL